MILESGESCTPSSGMQYYKGAISVILYIASEVAFFDEGYPEVVVLSHECVKKMI